MIFEKLFSKENKRNEIVHTNLSHAKFNKLKIKFPIGNITVGESEEFAVTFCGKQKYLPTINLVDEKLIIKQKTKIGEIGDKSLPDLTITLPVDTPLDQIDIQTNSGNIELIDVKAEKAYLKSNEGRVRVRRVAIAETLLESTNGNITVRNSDLADGKLASYDGEIKVSGSTLSDIGLNITDGDMNLTDIKLEGGSANLKAGNFTLDHAHFKSDYQIKNIEGSNTVWNANIKYAHVRTANGQNNVSFDPNPAGVVVSMTTVDGDNVVE